MKISTKIIIIIIALSIVTIISGCNEEFGSDDIKDGCEKPALNYLYTFNYYTGKPNDWLYFGYHSLIESKDNGPVTAMEWNTTFLVKSSFPLSDIKIKSTEPWLTCERLEGEFFSITAETYNSVYDGEDRKGHVYLTPSTSSGGDNHDYIIDVEVCQPGRNLVIYEDGKWLSSIHPTISFAENGDTSKTYEVRAEGEYTITKGTNDTWYSITHSKENNTFFVTVIPNTTSAEREGSINIALSDLPTGQSKEFKIQVIQSKGSEQILMLYTPGNGNGWDFNSGWLQTDDFINYYGFSHLDQEFKITDRPSWDGTIWGDGGNGKIEKGAYDNIPFPQEGLFWVKVNLQAETFAVNKVSAISIIGDLINDFWQPIYLTPKDDDKLIWSADATFAKGNKWAFSINFINSEKFEWGGKYFGEEDDLMIVQEDGNYSITLDLSTLPYKYRLAKK